MVVKEVFDFERDGKKYYYGAYNKYEDDKIIKSEKHKGVFYYKEKCGKCGGHGIIGPFLNIMNEICFDCGGSGYRLLRIYTAANKSTIERRLQKEKNQIDKHSTLSYKDTVLKNTLSQFGEDFYIVLDTKEKSTYKYKEDLKQQGCKWNSWFGAWYSEGKEIEGFHNIKIHTRDYLTNDNVMKYDILKNMVDEYRKSIGIK